VTDTPDAPVLADQALAALRTHWTVIESVLRTSDDPAAAVALADLAHGLGDPTPDGTQFTADLDDEMWSWGTLTLTEPVTNGEHAGLLHQTTTQTPSDPPTGHTGSRDLAHLADDDPTDRGVPRAENSTWAETHGITHPAFTQWKPLAARTQIRDYLAQVTVNNQQTRAQRITRYHKSTLIVFLIRRLIDVGGYGITSGEFRYLVAREWLPTVYDVHHGMTSGLLSNLRDEGWIIEKPNPAWREGSTLPPHVKRQNLRGNEETVFVLSPARAADIPALIQGHLDTVQESVDAAERAAEKDAARADRAAARLARANARVDNTIRKITAAPAPAAPAPAPETPADARPPAPALTEQDTLFALDENPALGHAGPY
jgi:hypothetical protein